MSFDQDPNEQADVSGADLAIMIDHVKELEQQNLALLAAIEQMCAVIPAFRPEYGAVGSRDVDVAKQIVAYDEALAIQPSADLLAERDRKRDAELLRDAATIFHCRSLIGTKNGRPITKYQYQACMYADIELKELAAARLDGTWEPTL